MCTLRKSHFAFPVATVFAVALAPGRLVAQNIIFPPHSMVEGRTISEWQEASWKWRVETPVADARVFPGGGPYPEVFFLVGDPTRQPPMQNNPPLRTRRIPADVPVLVEIVSTLTWRGDKCDGCGECQQSVSADIDQISMLEFSFCEHAGLWPVCDVLLMDSLLAHRESSETCFSFVFPQGALEGFASGPRFDAAFDGYSVMLRPLKPGRYEVRTRAVVGPEADPLVDLSLGYALDVRAVFLRGDCNGDGNVDLSDAVCMLDSLFDEAGASSCTAALNVNGDEKVDLADAVALLNYLFGGGAAPVAPYPECGLGELPADADLGCENPPNC